MEPWEIKEDDERTADGLILYLIFCEDEVSEVHYFKSFPEPDGYKISVVGKFSSKTKHVLRVINHCLENKYMTDNDGFLDLDKDQVRVWCVYDNDLYNEKQANREKLDFRLSVDQAVRHGLNVAWSNDAFELWILLHFEEYDSQQVNDSRVSYYEKLSVVLETPARQSVLLGDFLKGRAVNYKNDLKKDRAFRSIVLPALKANTEIAIQRAKELHAAHIQAGRHSCDQQVPCTLVYQLVEELSSLQKELTNN